MNWAFLVACAVALSPSPADACSCGGPRVRVWPDDSVVAPRNAQIRVTWPAEGSGRSMGSIEPGPQRAPWERTLMLVAADGTPVLVERRSWRSGEIQTLLLTPLDPLAPSSRYHVALGTDLKRRFGTIVTGTTLDVTPPTWQGVGAVRYVHLKPSIGDCSPAAPFALIELADRSVQDDDTKTAQIAFAVWPATGRLDNTTLLAIVSSGRHGITIGASSMCDLSNFALSSTTPTKLRIAPIDRAGNVGPPADVTIVPPAPSSP